MSEQPIRPAATVIIARPSASQFEILMLKRANAAVFAGGMYVFPGGKIDARDGDPALQPHLSPLSPKQRAQKNALGDQWQACWVAAIRETFEEAGILLAYNLDDQLVDTKNIDTQEYRSAIHAEKNSMIDLCRNESLSLALDQLHFFNRWVTPEGRPRRFDTRFFLVHERFIHNDPEQVSGISGELNQLHWLTLNQARKLDLPSITRWVIDRVETRIQLEPAEQLFQPAPFVRFVRGNMLSEEL